MEITEVIFRPDLIVLVGLGLAFIGYGPLSKRRNPAAGVWFIVFGFLFRLAGPLLLVWAALLLLFVVSMVL